MDRLHSLSQPFTRCFYHQARQVFDRPPSFWTAYHLDLVGFVYKTVRLFALAIILDRPHLVAHFRPVDPTVACLSTLGGSAYLMGFLWIFGAFHVFCRVCLARISVGVGSTDAQQHWAFYRAVVVTLQDQYHAAALPPTVLRRCRQRAAERLIFNLKSFFPDFLWLRLIPLRFVFPLRWAAATVARLIVWVRFEAVNRRRFFSGRLFKAEVSCSLSPAIKREAVLVMLASDKIAAMIQVVVGMCDKKKVLIRYF